MGREAAAVGDWQGQSGPGKATLETDFVRFSGPFRVRLAFAACRSIDLDGPRLRFVADDGVLALDLGDTEAARWLDRIRNPPSLGQKLGLKPDRPVRRLGPVPPEVEAELARLGCPVAAHASLSLLTLDLPHGLSALERCAEALMSGDDVWVFFEKGRKDVTGTDVIRCARAVGLIDTKVCRVSESMTGQRFRKRG